MYRNSAIVTTLFALMLIGTVMAQGLPPATGSTDSIKNAVCQIYNMINIALPAIIFLMVVLAAA
ncbi:MAG: hypothetical protein QW035_04245, partial [Candidatus Anstonellales archaeon]